MGDSLNGRVTLDELFSFDEELRRICPRTESWQDPGLGELGLFLSSQLDDCRYPGFTPRNCRCFAGTAGNGVHFSFLETDGRYDGDCPVVVTVPQSGPWNHIVGESLHDFLCFGCLRGYFALEQLNYEPDLTLEVFTNPEWRATDPHHDWVGYTPDERHRAMLELLTARFELQPWTGPERFRELQARYLPELIDSDFDDF